MALLSAAESLALKEDKVVWHFNEEEMRQAAAAGVGDKIISPIIRMPHGALWIINLYPKGDSDAERGHVSAYLHWDLELNAEVNEVNHSVIRFTFKANGEKGSLPHVYKRSQSVGIGKLCRQPSFAPGTQFSVELLITEKYKPTPTVDEWFSALPYAQYREALEREGYDSIKAIRFLDDSELRRCGVALAGHRAVLLKRAAALK